MCVLLPRTRPSFARVVGEIRRRAQGGFLGGGGGIRDDGWVGGLGN